jgi:hypothetical protein
VTSNATALIPARGCLSMPLNMKLSFAHSRHVAAVEGAWPVMALFTSHQQMHGGPAARVVGCSHFSRQHYGGRSAPRRRHSHTSEIAPKWASGSTCWSEFLCLGGYLAPPRQVGGVCPTGCARSKPLRRPPPLAPFHMSTMWD